jgi:hypothetical protein
VTDFGFDGLRNFNIFLLEHDMVLSGSTVLSTILGETWTISNLDLYAEKLDRNQLFFIEAEIMKMGYVSKGGIKGTVVSSSTFEKQSYSNKALYIKISWSTRNVTDVLMCFDFEFLSNIYTPRKGGELICHHPHSILHRRCFLNLDIDKLIYLRRSLNDNQYVRQLLTEKAQRIIKYKLRGFQVIGEPPCIEVFEKLFSVQKQLNNKFLSKKSKI